MKEIIGFIIQAIGLVGMLYAVRRQLNDLFIVEDDKKKQYTKNVLFFGVGTAVVLGTIRFIRLLYLVMNGPEMTPVLSVLNEMTFWANSLIYLEIGLAAFFLYVGNKRVL